MCIQERPKFQELQHTTSRAVRFTQKFTQAQLAMLMTFQTSGNPKTQRI